MLLRWLAYLEAIASNGRISENETRLVTAIKRNMSADNLKSPPREIISEPKMIADPEAPKVINMLVTSLMNPVCNKIAPYRINPNFSK